MIKGIYSISTGMNQKIKNMELVSNNLANINTTAYKKQIPFSEILEVSERSLIRQHSDFSQGEISSTNNDLDLAIGGAGFFKLQTEMGTELTRNGKFRVNNEGLIINANGGYLTGDKGPINVSEFSGSKSEKLIITKEGELYLGDTFIDKLIIIQINNPDSIVRTSGSNFRVIDEDEVVQADELDYEILQGYLEESNVNPLLEMEAMIKLNKEYESAQKIMNGLDDSLSKAVDIGRV